MENWLKISLILSLFGFFKEIRPNEPFIYEYLSGNWTNLTQQEVTEDIFPIGTYVHTSLVLVAFLVTDLLRYKPLIISCGIFGIIVWTLLIWTPSLLMMQIMEIFYAAFSSCDIAYFTYIYAKVDKEHYPKVTSNTRISYLLGRSISAVMSQLLTMFDIMDYKQLNYITLGAMVLATITSLLLPSVKNSIYFHRKEKEHKELINSGKTREAFHLMKKFVRESFSNDLVLKWSIINAVSACSFGMVQNYIQTLWTEINKTDQVSLANGFVVFIYTLIGVVGSYFAGYFKTDWSRMSPFLFVTYFSITGGLLILTSQTNSVYVSYAVYSVCGGLYYFVTTVAYSEISQRIHKDSYGLILGINTFIGLVLQSIITSIVVKMLHTPIRQQYVFYGSWDISIAVLYVIYEVCSRMFCKKENTFNVETASDC